MWDNKRVIFLFSLCILYFSECHMYKTEKEIEKKMIPVEMPSFWKREDLKENKEF